MDKGQIQVTEIIIKETTDKIKKEIYNGGKYDTKTESSNKIDVCCSS